MGLDTKYRPQQFHQVLGQADAIRILRQQVIQKTCFHQSYLFSGPFGSGKTTMGRLSARAFLCDNPSSEGDPCDQCPSCHDIMKAGTSADFVEIDAATNSGKADIKQLLEQLAYTTFSGKHRIYLFDESHRLSKDALDALLKPLEDNIQGSLDKQLVCIFCTTEPEKMRTTILSRCLTFSIETLPPDVIAVRLAFVCEQENFEYDQDVLQLIAEVTECHIRDALKTIEGVSLLGPINYENASVYLHLDLNTAYLDVLDHIGNDLPAAIQTVELILAKVSPTTCYERLANVAALAYKVYLGAVKPESYWDADRISALGAAKHEQLLSYITRFASRPGHPTQAMLCCDLACLHHGVVGNSTATVIIQAPLETSTPSTKILDTPTPPAAQTRVPAGTLQEPQGQFTGTCWQDERAIKREGGETASCSNGSTELDAQTFCWLLGLRLKELDEARRGGQQGRGHLDSD